MLTNTDQRKEELQMRNFILNLAEDYNSLSKLIALNHEQIKEGENIESILQFNKGQLSRIEKYLNDLSESVPGVHLIYEYGEHIFGADDWERQLKYTTVLAVIEDKN